MAYSSTVGKAWSLKRIRELAPTSIVDVGPGSGTYRDLVGDDPAAYWIGVEVFEPYVERFRLRQRYDQIIVADAAWMDWSLLGRVDLVILGDVLEHMDRPEASRVWDSLRLIARHLILSIPLGVYSQGASSGNRFEAHLSSWTLDDVLALPGVVDHAAYTSIGVFLAEGCA